MGIGQPAFQRERICERELMFIPRWEGPVAGWATRHIRNNLWRVLPFYEFDDLFQEAYYFFEVVQQRYDIENDKHFMSLYQRCFTNHIHQLARWKTRRGSLFLTPGQDDETDGGGAEIDRIPDIATELDLEMMGTLNDLPKRLRTLFMLLLTGDYKRGKFESSNHFYCRVLGLDCTAINVRQEVDAWKEIIKARHTPRKKSKKVEFCC
jgi:hypothetical protein